MFELIRERINIYHPTKFDHNLFVTFPVGTSQSNSLHHIQHNTPDVTKPLHNPTWAKGPGELKLYSLELTALKKQL